MPSNVFLGALGMVTYNHNLQRALRCIQQGEIFILIVCNPRPIVGYFLIAVTSVKETNNVVNHQAGYLGGQLKTLRLNPPKF